MESPSLDFSNSVPQPSSKSELTANKFAEIPMENSKIHQQFLVYLGPAKIPIYFPYEPYSLQIAYMEKVIETLDGGQNALLQSPTGTGKTLCLLCSCIGWINWKRKNTKGKDEKPFRLLYSSRTHAQLKQVVNELKNTAYRPLTSIIGSRDQYCIKREFQNLKGLILNGSCAKARKLKMKPEYKENDQAMQEGIDSCKYYQTENDLISKTIPKILKLKKKNNDISDIEELRDLGKKNHFCPYYFSIKILNDVDVLFLPYSYIIERRILSLSLENTILIFDEAHNIEQVAEEGSSYSLSLKDLDSALEELNVLQELQKKTLDTSSKSRLKAKKDQKKENQNQDVMLTLPEHIPLLTAPIMSLRGRLKNFLNEDKNVKKYNKDEKGVVIENKEIFDFFIKMSKSTDSNIFEKDSKRNPYGEGWHAGNLRDYLEILGKALEDLSDSTFIGLDKLTVFLDELFNLWVNYNLMMQNGGIQDWENIRINHYKLYVKNDVDDHVNVHMDLWCFSPALAFRDIMGCQIRSIILTSGTMAPFKSFEAETKLDFKVMLSNPHVVNTAENLLAGVFTKGPQDTTFNFCYDNRDKEEMFLDLGEAMLNLSRQIPNGILMVFASYQLLDKCYELWAKNNYLKRIEELKMIIKEPRSSGPLQDRMRLYMKNARGKGAILLAVCRGKVSEGIDFSDELARAVILVGIPFPPKFERRIELKQKYLDMIGNNRIQLQKRLSGREWYLLQAIRAMNQAIGRVIRHKHDYGAVLFFDVRYNTNEVKKEISGWIRDQIKVWQSFGHGYKEVMEFFKRKREPTNILQLNAMLNRKNEGNFAFKPFELVNDDQNIRKSEAQKNEIKLVDSSRESSLLKKINKFDEIIKNNSEDRLQPESFKKIKGENNVLRNDFDDPLLELLDIGIDDRRPPPEIKTEVHKLYIGENKNNLITQPSIESQSSNTTEEKKRNISMDELKKANSKDDLRNCTLTISSLEDLEAIKSFLNNKEKLECMICYNMDNELYSSKCGHVACQDCWRTWLKLQLVCPKCKARVRERTLFKVYSK